jgi:hypothetical protein
MIADYYKKTVENPNSPIKSFASDIDKVYTQVLYVLEAKQKKLSNIYEVFFKKRRKVIK